MLFLDKSLSFECLEIRVTYAEYQSATRFLVQSPPNFYQIFTKFLPNFYEVFVYEIFLRNFFLWGFLSTQFFSLGVFQALWFFTMWNHLAHRKFTDWFSKHYIFWHWLQIELGKVHKSWNCEKLDNCCYCKKLNTGADDPRKFSKNSWSWNYNERYMRTVKKWLPV